MTETENYVEIVYDCFKKLIKQNRENPNTFIGVNEHGNNFSLQTKMFDILSQINGFNGQIKVASDKQFKDYQESLFYHGYRKKEHMQCYFINHGQHYGYGLAGNGFYLSSNIQNAMKYTEKKSIDERIVADKNRILPIKFTQKAKGVSFERLALMQEIFDIMHTKKTAKLDPMEQGVFKKFKVDQSDREKLVALKKFCNSNSDDNDIYKFKELFMKDKNILALYLGYDYIVKSGQLDSCMDLNTFETDDMICTHVVGLNNGAMVTAESEYLKICNENQR